MVAIVYSALSGQSSPLSPLVCYVTCIDILLDSANIDNAQHGGLTKLLRVQLCGLVILCFVRSNFCVWKRAAGNKFCDFVEVTYSRITTYTLEILFNIPR